MALVVSMREMCSAAGGCGGKVQGLWACQAVVAQLLVHWALVPPPMGLEHDSPRSKGVAFFSTFQSES